MKIQVIRCSKLSRVMACLGSLHFTDIVEEENDAAKAGTAYGRLVQHYIEGTEPGTECENGVHYDSDMKFYARPAADEMLSHGVPILCERKIRFQTDSGIWVEGSSDHSYELGEDLVIEDNKYGWNLVEVQENWQLIAYAIGEVIARQKLFKNIRLKIRQPRPHHEDGPVREWVITYAQLLQYKQRIEDRFMQIARGDQTLTTSKECKYCPAATVCPALNKAFFRGVEVVHEFVQDQISDQELSFQLDLVTRVGELCKIKKDSLEALARQRITKENRIIPGWSVEQNLGDRKWKSIVTPEFILAMTGKDIIKKEILSPAQAEKVGVPKKVVEKLVERHFIGVKLKRVDSNKDGEKIFGKKEG